MNSTISSTLASGTVLSLFPMGKDIDSTTTTTGTGGENARTKQHSRARLASQLASSNTPSGAC